MSRHQSIREKSIVYSLWTKVFPSHRQAQSRDLQTSSLQSSVFSLRSSKGFTLLEMLVVVAILMLLAGLILAAVTLARDRAKVLRARRDVAQLKSAWDTYYADYNAFPDPAQIGGNSLVMGYMATGRDVIQILRGLENHHGQNPKGIPYMDFHQNTTYFNDPWGNPYRIALDADYDGDVSVPGNNALRMSVAAWSAGPDGRDDTDDDVRSWRE